MYLVSAYVLACEETKNLNECEHTRTCVVESLLVV